MQGELNAYPALRIFLDGMLYMMALYALLSYLQLRKAIYWQYALYIVCVTLTFYLNDLDYQRANYLPGTNFPITLLESLAFVMYISFAIQLIGIKARDPFSYRIIRGMIVLLAIETLADCLLFTFPTSDEVKSLSYTFFRSILALGALVVVPRILRLRQPVVSYFIVGTLFFVLGCVVALSINYIPSIFTRSADSPLSYPVFYMELGVVAEVLCFSLGMSLENQKNEREKIRFQEELIEQLQENKLKQQRLLRIRDDIARDLHDELGADLAGISMLSQAAINQLPTDPALTRHSLGQISEMARKVIKVMREIVWSLHSAHDSADHFAYRLRETAHDLFVHHPTQLHFVVEESQFLVPSAARRELYLIYKELLHNVLRHAGAQNVYVRLSPIPDGLKLTVQDDGQGFDPDGRFHGNGLISIQQRAQLLGGTFRIQSDHSQGTTMTVECPLWEESLASV
ncbi:hypothetical protein GCM10027275_47820 [Rhabdobacter roseus]|uniref:Signal transduction histidine kinase n=1 Tax=Rhabdobacter roseus TaxID=1655419 RepID=A0A840TTV5_9BACT|nr:sensor histidine kinase [Rhabdobacter roseus]MBB5286335.1 signal transduction histidine kinase [Rhabdobacter roseus]